MNDLIERYIYAVTRRLPRSKQEDMAKELRGLVEDMLLERCGEAMPEEKDVRIVLTELGSPQIRVDASRSLRSTLWRTGS